MIRLLPKKLQNWLALGLIGILIGQFFYFLHWLFFAQPMVLLDLLNSNFTSDYLLVRLSAQLLVGFFAGVLLYWWEIGRKKE